MNDLGKSKGFITFAAIALAVVLCASAVFAGVWFGQKSFPLSLTPGIANVAETPPNMDESLDVGLINPGQVYDMPQKMSFTAQSLAAAQATGQTIDVRIFATVSPSDAVNKEVDYSIDWSYAPTHGSEPVTDYVTVTQDSDGSAYATVSCKKAFGYDHIRITVTTRDGGFSASCAVYYEGKASSFDISSSNVSLTSDGNRGSYYALGTGKTYTFDLNLSNAFGAAQTKDLKVSLSGSGSLYFAKALYHYDAVYYEFSDYQLKNMSDMVNNFISAEISGDTLTITTGDKIMKNYFSSSEKTDSEYREYLYDRYVCDNGNDTGNYTTYYNYNVENIEKCYFTVKVLDSTSGLSKTIKIWVVSSVTGVNLSQLTMTI